MACSWCVEGYKKKRFLVDRHPDTNNSVMGTLKEVDARIDVIPPTNSNTMPDMILVADEIFRMVKHVRSGDLEGVLRKIVTESLLLIKRKPDFLKKYKLLRLVFMEKVQEVLLVSFKSFQVKRQ